MCTQMELIECFDIPIEESVPLYFIKIAGCNPRFLRKSAVCIPQFFRIKGAQLLFTTHDTYLLGAGLLRRDQVWFTQKDGLGATSLYSLAEYKVRSNAAFDRDYINDRYGATPIIGEMERVFERNR